jgi:hypothetical protein
MDAMKTVYKRKKVPLKSPTSSTDGHNDQEKAQFVSNASSPNSFHELDHDDDNSADGRIEMFARKQELMRIVNKEEEIRKKSLLNLQQELELEGVEVENGDGGGNESITFVPLTRRNTDTNQSIASSSWTDEEGLHHAGLKSKFRRRRRNTFTDEELAKIPRLVQRNMPFKQSRQEIAVVNKTLYKGLKVQRILSSDWYHVFLRYNTMLSLLVLLAIFTVGIILFAFVYMKIDASSPETNCGLGTAGNPISFGPAFAFSLETCTTVGYGLPNGTNGFFEPECGHLQIFIYFQMIFSMCFNAFLFAFLFARLARCEQRGSQVLFGDKAIIEKRNGKWLMHVRVYDYASSQPVVEAHVRMYCVSWRDYEKQTRDLVQPHLLHAMRILQPDDSLNASLYTSIPLNVTHQIDTFSPLLPKAHKKKCHRMDVGGLQLREIDQIIDNTGIMCPVCGETYGSQLQLKKHIEYNAMIENMDPAFPITGSHRDPHLVEPFLAEPKELTENDIREHLKDKEIMVVVEGIEPMVSGTFQALQSYKIQDILFGGRFAPCMSQQAGRIYVDVDRFHEVLPPSDDSVRNFNQFRADAF